MSGFSKHNIDHLSASSINMFAAAPCAWVAKYLYSKKFNFSLAAKAGTLVEEAVVNVLARGWTEENAIAEAVKSYNKASAFGATDAEIKRGEAIPGMIENALAELKQYGEPEFDQDLMGIKQKKIELLCKCESFDIPLIGYLDFFYKKHGLIVDLKTTMAAPSSMSNEHLRQGAIYRQAMGNHAVKFLYVTGKKAVVHEIPDPAPVLAEIKSIIIRQERLLRHDAEDIRSFVPVISSSYYWSGDEGLRQEMYEI